MSAKPWKSARSTLVGAGLGVRYAYEEESPAIYGTVVFQVPAAGQYLPKGSSAIIVLAD
ncbi:MAG: PASTA domain-containing protein [Actinomycetes bacterium]|nr:PASTA domain-containing protein [Actinomycetes bacterium]